MQKILNFIRKILPPKILKKILPLYHFCLAKISALIYNYPANKMLVIGVTGTAGKSSSCYFIAQILSDAGLTVGMITTTLFKIGPKEWLNDKKMTMLGRFQTQKMLAQMVQKKCQVAIIETSSQGIDQFRHISINYDFLVFTNLYPEHIEAHGGFENYKNSKGKLFRYLMTKKHKNLLIGNQKITPPKTIIANLDDQHVKYFLNFSAEKKITYGFNKLADIKPENLVINLLGKYNIYNVLPAVAVAKILNIDEEKIKKAVANLKPLPGRLEFIENNRGIKIVVDYAFEPEALKKIYQTIKNAPHNKIIHVLGAAGGGRDAQKRPKMGLIAAENSDLIIITNEDPYDEDPQKIIAEVANGIPKNKQIYKILDRREAIRKSLELAKEGDLILITGKGAEQAICVANGQMIPWDDRQVVREELKQF